MGKVANKSIGGIKASAIFIVMLMFASWIPVTQAQDPDLPTATVNNETLPDGALVIPMDHLLQNNNGAFTYFDIRAYGFLNEMLQRGIPLKWVIRTGKAKDAIDFTANASRVRPTSIGSASVDFRGSAFVILPQYATVALQVAASNFPTVSIYELQQNVTADVRYTLTHKPKISISGDNFAIHQALLTSAGFVENTHFFQQFASELPGECFTFHSEPHDVPSSAEVEGLIDFVQSGGNAFLQCEAVLNYENSVVASASLSGGFQSTAGIVNNELNTLLTFVEPDLAFSQFTGGLAFTGGSVGQWQLDAGNSSVYQYEGHSHAVENSDNSYIQMSQSKINGPGALGSNVFYLGGHQYANTGLTEVNGQRAYLNAIFVPAAPVNCPELTFNTIYGRVFLDDDFDGILDAGENGYANITVEIRDSGNNLVATVTTASDGTWVAGVDTTGDYTITVIEPSGSYVTSNNDPQTVTVSGTETEADDVGINTIVAVDDSYSTPADTPVNGDVSVNDTFEPGSSFSVVTGPTNGSISFNANGTFTYTPNGGFNGTETFTYEVCAPSPNTTVCDLAEVTITIADLTIVKSNSPTTPVVAGDIITYTTTVTGTGSAALTNVGVIDAVPAGTVFVPGSVTSTITHPTLTLGNPALVSEVFTTTGSWTAPAGVTEVIVEAWGAGGASRNGTDRRGGAGGGGYARSVLSVTGGTSYTVTVGSGGTTSQQAGGNSWFSTTGTVFAEGGSGGADGIVPGGDSNIGNVTFNGGSGGARGTTAGGGGGGSATAAAAGSNGAAGSGGIGGAGGAGEGKGGDGGDNAQPGEDGLFPGGGAGGSGATVESINSGGNGQVIVHYIPVGTTGNPQNIASGWTLGPNSVLTVTFQVEVSDSPPAVITNTSTVSSDQLPDTNSNEVENAVQPVAADDAFSTPADTPVDGDVSTNDSAPPGSTFNKLTDPANGSVSFNDDGTFTYTPDPGFNGTDTFTYEVCAPAPNGTLCDEATVTITIADLTIVKSNNPDENTFVSPGDPITYTVTLTNTGSADLTNVSIEDIIPASTTYVANSVDFTFTGNSATSVSATFDTPGTTTWTAPAGVTEVTVEVWGAGGSTKNGTDSRGGAGGGAYARSTLAVTPGVTYNLQVGDGPTASETDGGGSWFNTSGTIFAQGGRKGGDGVALGGQAASSIGTVKFSGGSGGARDGNKQYGGGGGGSATPDGPGTNGTSAVNGGPAGVGGTGTGDGGDGGTLGAAGQDGQAPGGGGGGSGGGIDDVSAGGDGQVIITYETFGTVSAPGTLASGWNLAPGAVLEITYDVTIDDPATEIVFLNTATVTSDQLGNIQSNEVRNDISGLQITTGPCWRTISIPNSGQSYADFFASFRTNSTDYGGLWTQGATGSSNPGGDPNVYTMDATGENWIPVTDLSGSNIPAAGTGILISVFDEDQFGNPASAGFPKIAEFSGIENSAPVSVSLGTPGGTTSSVDGFSLLGNPFYSAIDFDLLTTSGITGNIWVYNRNAGGTDVNGNNGGWISWNGTTGDITDGIIASGQGFVVQNTNPTSTPSVTFEEADKTAGGTFYGKENRKPDHIRMEVRGDGVYNSAWIQFSDEGVHSEIMSDDVVQFYPFESEYAVLSTVKQGKLMDIGHFPYPGENVQIPLTVETTTTDQLTITLTNLQYSNAKVLYLHDTITGRTMEIEEGLEYSFTPTGSPAKSVVDCYSAPTGFAEPVIGKAEGPRFYISSSAEGETNTLPSEYRLNQNYPNPFNPNTQITYQLPEQADVRLEVFDMSGRQIATLVNENVSAGTHTVNFNATNLSSGVYMYRLQTGSVILTKKLTLIK